MRIISGSARGRKLIAPKGDDTRPTADRIRESLYNILGSRVLGAKILDLFGGTGALALEALSRGAGGAVIVDSNRAAIHAIRQNALAVLGEDYSDTVRILPADYRSAIARLDGEKFDIVFLDPPYQMRDAYADALTRLTETGALAPGALIVLERRADVEMDALPGFVVFDTRAYGETALDFCRIDKESN